MIAHTDGDALFRTALRAVLSDGSRSAPRGKPVIGLTAPIVLTLDDPSRPFITTACRKANYRFGISEACWIMSGRDDVMTVARHNARMAEFSDNSETLWGAYGPRIVGQLPHVVSTLKRDRDSRQAIITTWRPMERPERLLPAGYAPEWDGASWRSKDVPCTVAWHFQIVNDRLQLSVFMRSNDAWLGLPYDVLSFTTVQRVVAAMLGIDVGQYHHVVSNLHLYEEHVTLAEILLGEPASEPLPALPAFGSITPEIGLSFVTQRFDRTLTKANYVMNDACATLFQSVIHRQADPFGWSGLRSLQVR